MGVDIVCISDINVDSIYVISPDAAEASSASIAQNQERIVTREIVQLRLSDMRSSRVAHELGGSGVNAARAAKYSNGRLQVGVLGAAASHADGRSEARAWVPGIDLHLYSVDAPRGECVVINVGVDRSVETFPGANAHFCEALEENWSDAVGYCASARLLHITSVFDEAAPDLITRLIDAVAKENPAIIVTFDPGSVWCDRRSEDIAPIIRRSDLLAISQREGAQLGLYSPSFGPVRSLDLRSLSLRSRESLVAIKTRAYADIFDASGEHLLHIDAEPPAASDHVDATGAGDVFVGSVLAWLASRELQVGVGAYAGVALADRKLRSVGSPYTRTSLSTSEAVGYAVAKGGSVDASTEPLDKPDTRTALVLLSVLGVIASVISLFAFSPLISVGVLAISFGIVVATRAMLVGKSRLFTNVESLRLLLVATAAASVGVALIVAAAGASR